MFLCSAILASLFWFTRKKHQVKHRDSQNFQGDLVFVKVTPLQQREQANFIALDPKTRMPIPKRVL